MDKGTVDNVNNTVGLAKTTAVKSSQVPTTLAFLVQGFLLALKLWQEQQRRLAVRVALLLPLALKSLLAQVERTGEVYRAWFCGAAVPRHCAVGNAASDATSVDADGGTTRTSKGGVLSDWVVVLDEAEGVDAPAMWGHELASGVRDASSGASGDSGRGNGPDGGARGDGVDAEGSSGVNAFAGARAAPALGVGCTWTLVTPV